MYLIGHTNPTLIMRVYQQVLDMGDASVETLEKAIGCSLPTPSHCFWPGGCPPIVHRPEKTRPNPETWSGLEGAETAR
jgi:hypothetical protein